MHKATLATLTNPHTQLISIEGSTPRGCQSMQRVLQWPSPAQLKAKAFGFDSLNKNAGKHQSCLRNGAETVDGWSLDLLLCLLCLLITSNYPSGKLLRHALDSRILRVIKSKLHARSRYLAQRDLSEWCVPMLRDAPRCTDSLQRVFVVPVVPVVPGSLERIWHKLQGIRHEVVQAHQCLGTGTLAMFRNVQKRPETVMEGLDTDTLCQNFTTLAAKLQQ